MKNTGPLARGAVTGLQTPFQFFNGVFRFQNGRFSSQTAVSDSLGTDLNFQRVASEFVLPIQSVNKCFRATKRGSGILMIDSEFQWPFRLFKWPFQNHLAPICISNGRFQIFNGRSGIFTAVSVFQRAEPKKSAQIIF